MRTPPSPLPASRTTPPREPSSPAGDGTGKPARKAPAPALRYIGVRATAEGREYTLQAAGEDEPRLFVLLISHQAFVENKLSFQDAPSFCFNHVLRDLASDPELAPRTWRLMTGDALRESQRTLETRPTPR